MRVTEVVIDGFKSYAVRTVISGWDESFNSITGLNGSGKSNILDAICFVLGITNMSTVRAQNLQDLIYKRGQAGVTKASVTIVFDNRDKKKSPIGFEEYAQISVTRQIVLGGTSKYLINGHRAQQHTVQNLFQSVQLNINNPNFLIMQGRITKVLNMKPQEILAMIEEAAGTRMFEDRKEKAFKTMTKKEMKVQEITALLKEEIDPKLEKLRQEKRAFLDFQQTQSDLERMTKLVVAYDYVRSKEKSQQASEDLEAKRASVTAHEDATVRLKGEVEFLQEDISKIKIARDKELKKGGKFVKLEEQVRQQSNEMVRLSTAIDLKTSGASEEQARKETLQSAAEALTAQLAEKEAFCKRTQERFDEAKTQLQNETLEVERQEELLQTLQTGVASREGQEAGYQGQLQGARDRVSAVTTEQEQARLKITHLQSRVKEDDPRARKAEKENSGLLKSLDELKSQAKSLEAQLQKSGYDTEREKERTERIAELHSGIRHLQAEAESLKRKVSNIDFAYSDPVPNFNRAKVKGLVAQLFTLDEKRHNASTALEISAGGRLYNVVVDSAETGTQLLKAGGLRKRVTIIPLNKISPYTASAQKIAAAQRIAPGKVDLALSLVGYDDEITAAMEFVFGSTFVCADAETAKKITFDPAVRMKSVTLEGDVYDPSGTLSGGSAPKSSGVLLSIQKLNGINAELQAKTAEYENLRADLERDQQKLAAARKTKQELDLKNHEISLKEEQINNNSASAIILAVERMRNEIAESQNAITNAKSRLAEAQKDVKRIEKDMAEFSQNKGGKLAELRKNLEKMRKSIKMSTESLKPIQQESREATVEFEQIATDLESTQEQICECDASLSALQDELHDLRQVLENTKERHDIALAELDDERAKLSGFDDELTSLEDAVRSKTSQISDGTLECQKLNHQIDRLEKEKQAISQVIAGLVKDYDWIEDEQTHFGKPGTPYDFMSKNMNECKSSLKNVMERFQGMKKKINPKVMNMIDSVEKKEVSLKNMMKTVIRDKKKIEETVESLDEYKKEALERTWTKVNADFGQIFSELLPGGSFAKLDPIEGKTIAEGLEVKVQLGKVWKQSLTELSGGQRSLIALSLIMALLQFKPAPMYILDEVDAALDLSHTQNIGRLIKTRFKGSQFIVVSLKDGMFTNANRIFKTRFSEGTSMVQALTPADLK